MKKLNSRGFSIVEALIIIVVIALGSGVGYNVWKRSKDKPTLAVSQAETSQEPINIYKARWNYKVDNSQLYALGWIAGDEKMAQEEAENPGIIVRSEIAFQAYPLASNIGVPVKYMSIAGGGSRTDLQRDMRGQYRYQGTNSVVMTVNSEEVTSLKRLGFTENSARFRAYATKVAGTSGIYRLRKTVTTDGRRMYEYTDSVAKRNSYMAKGYTNEGIVFYTLAPK